RRRQLESGEICIDVPERSGLDRPCAQEQQPAQAVEKGKRMPRYFWGMLFVLGASSIAAADETCNSPYVGNLIKGQEDYVYVWALGIEGLGDGSDKLVAGDVDARTGSYGSGDNGASSGHQARGQCEGP